MTNLSENSTELLADIYDDGFLRVEHENYYVSCGGKNIKLPRAEFLILSRLVRSPERFVSSSELWAQAWGSRKKFNAVSLHVYMYRLRRKFEPLGIQIETMVNVGYRIVPRKAEQPPAG
jgi:DNA-binding response OmpR family regulator